MDFDTRTHSTFRPLLESMNTTTIPNTPVILTSSPSKTCLKVLHEDEYDKEYNR